MHLDIYILKCHSYLFVLYPKFFRVYTAQHIGEFLGRGWSFLSALSNVDFRICLRISCHNSCAFSCKKSTNSLQKILDNFPAILRLFIRNGFQYANFSRLFRFFSSSYSRHKFFAKMFNPYFSIIEL